MRDLVPKRATVASSEAVALTPGVPTVMPSGTPLPSESSSKLEFASMFTPESTTTPLPTLPASSVVPTFSIALPKPSTTRLPPGSKPVAAVPSSSWAVSSSTVEGKTVSPATDPTRTKTMLCGLETVGVNVRE
ncbi:hypothetical protein D3C86_1475070 [compost metagenome]